MDAFEPITFTVPGKPMTWARAQRGRYGQSYTPEDREGRMGMIVDCWAKLDVPCFERESDISMCVEAVCKRPSNHWRANGELKPWALRCRPKGVGDVDNFGKLVSDALNGVAFYDDAEVVELLTLKRYIEPDGMPRTIVTMGLADVGDLPPDSLPQLSLAA